MPPDARTPAGSDPAVRWRRVPSVLSRRTDSDVLLLLIDSEEPVLASGAAAAVWSLLDAPTGDDDLLAAAISAVGAPSPQVRATLTEAVDLLSALGAIEPERRAPDG